MKTNTANKWIGQIARPHKGGLAALSVVSGLMAGGMVLFALLSRRVIDTATGAAEGSLWHWGAALLALVVAEALLNALSGTLRVRLSGKMDIRIRDTVTEALFRKRWQDVKEYHSGELLNRLTSDSRVVVDGLVTLVPQLIGMGVRLLACVAVLATVDWRFTLVLVGAGLLMVLSTRLYGKRMKSLHKECQAEDGKVKSFTQESLANWTVIQSFSGADTVRERLRQGMDRHLAAEVRRARWSNLAHGGVYLLFNGSYYGALLWGAVGLMGNTLTFGTFTAFLQLVGQLRLPFMNLSGILPQYYNMVASAERLLELLHLPEEPRRESPLSAEEIYSRLDAIAAEGVTFAYDREAPVLTDATLTVKKGEFVALTGHSGIGKSTLFQLLLGFYAPQEGRLVARTEGEALPLGGDTRCLFAYVPQQNRLTSGTVRENIAFCCGDVTDEAVWAAAETACVAEAIRALPQGLDAVLGERGAGLSEGQLQRLAIARGVLSGAPILLLDEVTSSLDEATEAQVLRNLRALTGRTCLCISHRPAAMEVCDRVVRLEKGQFVEE